MFQIALPTLIVELDILIDLMKPKSRHKILAAISNRDLVLYRTVELLLSVRATVMNCTEYLTSLWSYIMRIDPHFTYYTFVNPSLSLIVTLTLSPGMYCIF